MNEEEQKKAEIGQIIKIKCLCEKKICACGQHEYINAHEHVTKDRMITFDVAWYCPVCGRFLP